MSSGHLEVKLIDSDDQHHEELSDEQKESWTTVVLTEVQQDIESPSRKVAQDSASSPGANSNHPSLVRDARSRFSYRLNEVVLYLSVPISVFITVGIIVYYIKTKNALIVARVTSGYCTLFTLFVTGLLVYVHLCNYTRPTEQRYIIRILAMAPIYCVDSFIALWGTQYSQLIGLIRDTYESYVLYMFVYLLLEYLGGERNALESLRKTKPTMKHLFPFCCLQPIVFSEKTFFWWKLWLLQYVLIKPLATCVAIAFTANGLYHEGVISWKNSWVYISFVTNLSVMCAFSVVLYIYQATKELLFAHNPFGKFLAIKSVVFLIFWQSVALDVLVHMGWIRMFEDNDKWTAEMIASAFGNMLVCIEMALLAILHRYVFGFEHYLVHTNEKVTWEKVTHMLSQRDVVQNVVHLTEEGKEHLRRHHHEIKVSSIPEIETPNINEAGDKSE